VISLAAQAPRPHSCLLVDMVDGPAHATLL